VWQLPQMSRESVDIGAAIEVVIAGIDGRPLTDALTAERLSALVGGFGGLVYALSSYIAGDDDPAAVRQVLADMQARHVITSLFGEAPYG
jgi:hypothetical protein